MKPMAKTLCRLGAIVLVTFAIACTEDEPRITPAAIDELARSRELVYPGARLLERQTELLREAHFILNPYSKVAPLMAIYDTEASLDQVVAFYVARYDSGEPTPNESNQMRALPPPAFYSRGDLATDAQGVKPILDQLHVSADISRAIGSYRGATFLGKPGLPRVTLQRPYFDVLRSETVDRTLIVMVNDER